MIEILFVGTYHMANPGADLVNLVADDVRQPKRQAELAALTQRLAAFAPTKVMVEWASELPEFAGFTPQRLLEEANEVVQLGFRLAALQGLPKVYGIDRPGEFPFEAVQAKAEKEGRLPELMALIESFTQKIVAQQERLATSTIGDYLAYLNSPEQRDESALLHMALLAFDSEDDSPAIRLALAWYERNLRIQLRLMQNTRPGDRVVIFYGSGHGYWLQEQLRTTPGYHMVDPIPYLKES